MCRRRLEGMSRRDYVGLNSVVYRIYSIVEECVGRNKLEAIL
jgi:hypothetical protein